MGEDEKMRGGGEDDKNERSKSISKSLSHPPSGRKLLVVLSFLIKVLFLWQCFMLLSKVSRGSFERRGGAIRARFLTYQLPS
jgi:hypothetical protein